ncbi:endolytic transglycosylase MltG [Parvicella tangerina]|uniref:Endolytic murein transglycosylase n=1 Tax=Parvicella tangerina TaxID=2829795 RepID=A0A916JKY6_9FLAO|nr:endolytic transglycosylase MltG [Parvicella tangerina]CAG5079637.1 Endolytic murein transglycosylase [Parvicella tangerina]
MKKIILLLVLAVLGVGVYIAYPYIKAYQIKDKATHVEEYESNRITFKKGMSINELAHLLQEEKIIENADDLILLAEMKQQADLVLEIEELVVEKEKWKTYNDLLNNVIVQNGSEMNTVDVQYNNVKSIEDVAGKLTRNIELDSAELADFLLDPETRNSLGFTELSYPTFFIPVKFEVYKDISKEEMLEKLKDYYKSFWNEERKAKAAALGYSQSEITILASIVYEEQKVKFDEQPKIAGLYLNRLKKGWLLQADPTVKYAIGDPSIKRLLYKHLEYESPYNTYLYTGLPPGPISFPEAQTIDAVLNYEDHEYMYMCAKPEYSGYHNFSKTLNQHNVYAKAYQKWLDQEGIQ